MKIYEIINEENASSVGVLLHYEKENTVIIELMETLDEWTAPLLFTAYVKKGIFTIPRDISFLWVQERVIPSGRQNINAILKNHHLKTYDEMNLLLLSKARCSQDHYCICESDALPKYVRKRQQKNLRECLMLEENQLLCFFKDDMAKKMNLDRLRHVEGVDKVLKNEKLFQSGKMGADGYYVTFNDSIDIPAAALYETKGGLPITYSDFITYIQKNVSDTAEVCEALDCSRQNLAYLVKKERLSPVKENVKGNLFLKADIERWKAD